MIHSSGEGYICISCVSGLVSWGVQVGQDMVTLLVLLVSLPFNIVSWIFNWKYTVTMSRALPGSFMIHDLLLGL